MCISVILYFFISTLSFRFEIGAKKRRLTEIFFFFSNVCQRYTFCQQSQRKLYSISYKTIISCCANIPRKPSLWWYSIRQKISKRGSPAPFHLTQNQEEALSRRISPRNPPVSPRGNPRRRARGSRGRGGGTTAVTAAPGSQHPGIPSSGLHRAPKMPSFPNKAPSTTRGLHYVLVGHRTRLGFVSFLSTPRASISWSSQLLEELGRRS